MIPFSLSDAVLLLSKTPGILQHQLNDLPDAWLMANEGPDTFSPYEVVGHLIHGEKTDWIPRMQIILNDGESRPFEPYDRFAQRHNSIGKTIHQLLEEFEKLRHQNLDMLKQTNISERTLALTGTHPALGKVTLRNLLATWVAHDMSHLAQIARVIAKQYAIEVGPWFEYMNILKDRTLPQ